MRRRAVRVLEEGPLLRERVEVGGRRAAVAVGADVVGAEGVDRDEQDVLARPVERAGDLAHGRSGGVGRPLVERHRGGEPRGEVDGAPQDRRPLLEDQAEVVRALEAARSERGPDARGDGEEEAGEADEELAARRRVGQRRTPREDRQGSERERERERQRMKGGVEAREDARVDEPEARPPRGLRKRARGPVPGRPRQPVRLPRDPRRDDVGGREGGAPRARPRTERAVPGSRSDAPARRRPRPLRGQPPRARRRRPARPAAPPPSRARARPPRPRRPPGPASRARSAPRASGRGRAPSSPRRDRPR